MVDSVECRHSDRATQELTRVAYSCWTKYHLQLSVVLCPCCALSYRQTEAQETVCCQSCDYTLGRRQPSVIFETNWRLLIGRKFLWVTSLAPFWCNNWNSKTFSRSVFIVYGSCFGGFKSGNGWHASMDQPALVQQLGVKIVPFMIKEWNLGHLQLISF